MVPLRCSIFAPDVQRTQQFEIEQHGTGIVASLEDKALGAPPKRSAVEQCCFLTAMMILTKKLTKSLLMKSMLIPLQISTLRTERRTSGFLEVASHSLTETGGHRYSKCLFDSGVAEQERTSVQCSWTRDA